MQDINEEDIFWHDYQTKARSTAIYPRQGKNLLYPMLGLIGEIGEIANKVKKIIRDDHDQITPECRQAIGGEIGDVLWYVANLCSELSIDMRVLNVDAPEEESCVGTAILLYQSTINMHYIMMSRVGLEIKNFMDGCGDEFPPVSWNLKQRLIYDFNLFLLSLHTIVRVLELDLREIATQNMEKLFDRKDRGVLGGSGDER
jgi:NTP pyrophosphatase (non-canonical NTP hydrolase)